MTTEEQRTLDKRIKQGIRKAFSQDQTYDWRLGADRKYRRECPRPVQFFPGRPPTRKGIMFDGSGGQVKGDCSTTPKPNACLDMA